MELVNGIGCERQVGNHRINFPKQINMAVQNLNLAPSPRQTLNRQGVLRIPGRKIKIATWNVKTLFKAGKLANAEYEMERMKWDVLGMSEVRWKGEGHISTTNGNRFYYSGGDQAQNGVGILISKNLTQYIKSFLPVNDRIVLIKISGHPFDTNLIQVYAPTAASAEEDLEAFYNDIKLVKVHTKNNHINIYLGDWNAKVGTKQLMI